MFRGRALRAKNARDVDRKKPKSQIDRKSWPNDSVTAEALAEEVDIQFTGGRHPVPRRSTSMEVDTHGGQPSTPSPSSQEVDIHDGQARPGFQVLKSSQLTPPTVVCDEPGTSDWTTPSWRNDLTLQLVHTGQSRTEFEEAFKRHYMTHVSPGICEANIPINYKSLMFLAHAKLFPEGDEHHFESMTSKRRGRKGRKGQSRAEI